MPEIYAIHETPSGGDERLLATAEAFDDRVEVRGVEYSGDLVLDDMAALEAIVAAADGTAGRSLRISRGED